MMAMVALGGRKGVGKAVRRGWCRTEVGEGECMHRNRGAI